jgi:hypothetical protein
MAIAAPRKVNYILSEAIYGSLQDRQFQAPINASYQEVALRFLESLLDEWRDKVPFCQQFTFDSVEELVNTNFTSVDNVNYILQVKNQVPLRRCTGKDEFYNQQYVIGLHGQPQVYYWDELQQTIDVYPTPNQPNYQFVVWGRTQMSAAQPEDDLPSNITAFMANALIYELAFRLCAEYGVVWSQAKESIRQQLIRYLDSKQTVDLSSPVKRLFKRPGRQVPPYPFYYDQWGFSGGGS